MPLKIIRCGLDADAKSEYFEEMKKIPRNKKVVLIVPDQYSYMAEKRMAEIFGGIGLNNRFVYTFSQLRRSFLNVNDSRYLHKSGKNMLLKTVIKNTIDEDSVFYAGRNRQGFVDSIKTLLCELKRYCVTYDMLYLEAKNTENSVLKNKLISIADIYREFEEQLNIGEFLDSEDDFVRLAEELDNSDYFADAYVFIDMFISFTPQHIGVLTAILRKAENTFMYLPAGLEENKDSDSLFEVPEKTVRDLKRLCEREKLEYSEAVCENKRKIKPAIKAFCDNFENTGFKYTDRAEEIRIFKAKEKYSEVHETALKILDLVREENLKFADITVVCADIEEYISFIEPVFFEYRIPYFADYKVLMSEQPIAVLITSLFDIINEKSFTKEACIRYLRTGFLVSDEETDLVEKHITKCGIRGNMWRNAKYWQEEKKVFDDVTGGKINKTDNRLEALRKKITEPIFKFEENTKGKKSVKEHCAALFEYLKDIELFNKLKRLINIFNETERENEALRFEQVWNFIAETAEQAVKALGNVQMSRSEFCELFVSGMAGCEISIVPSVSDGVAISDVMRGVTDEKKALLVIGAVNNAFPRTIREEGILNDNEREDLELELAPSRTKAAASEEFQAVMLLTTPTELLSISYPISDIEGNVYEPSPLISDLEEMFEKADKQNNLIEKNDFLYISSPEATIHKLLLEMAKGEKLNPIWEAVRGWYERNGSFADKLRIIDTALEYKNKLPGLSAETAELLYAGYDNYSISRIEKYFECPFEYFLNNGLKLRECKEWEIGSTDTGSLLHWAVCEYCKRVDGENSDLKQRKQNWNSLTKEESAKIAEDIIKEAEGAMDFSEYDEGKTKNILKRAEKALKKSVEIINLSMKNGKYTGALYETEFSEKEIQNSEGNIKIKGIIDRIDVYEDEEKGKAYIRIIDYKTGKKSFSTERILNRVDLQLAVYAIAAADMYKNGEIEGTKGNLEPVVKGIYYDKINKNFVECKYSGMGTDEEWILASKLDGTLFTEELGNGKNKYFDTVDAQNMDYEIETNGESRFLRLKKKEKGKGIDKVRSSVESEELRNAMLKYVKDSLIEADRQIKSGNIEISPYKRDSKKESACIFCPYKQICAPDCEKGVLRKRERDRKEIIEEILGGKE